GFGDLAGVDLDTHRDDLVLAVLLQEAKERSTLVHRIEITTLHFAVAAELLPEAPAALDLGSILGGVVIIRQACRARVVFEHGRQVGIERLAQAGTVTAGGCGWR